MSVKKTKPSAPESPADYDLRMQRLDDAALSRWTSLYADPTGSLREKDPELVDMLAFSLRRRSIGNDPQDRECGLFILERIRDSQSPVKLKAMFSIITRMKRHEAMKGAKPRRSSVIMPLWGPFLTSYLSKYRRPPTLNEFANHLVDTTAGTAIVFPLASCEAAWTKIWKAVGLSHRSARKGK